MAIAFFGIMCAQGAVWYFTFFYMQVFLEKSLGLPGATKDMLLIVMTMVSAPLYVFFGWLSDRVGRKPVMLAGMLLALALYFPGSHLIARAANPALVAAQQATPVIVETDPASCSVQFDPTGTAKFVSACDIAKATLVTTRHRLFDPSIGGRSNEGRGRQQCCRRSRAREGLPGTELKALKTEATEAIGAALKAAGYPTVAEPGRANMPAADRCPAAVRRCRNRALRAAGGGAGRDVPDPDPLHGHVACPITSAPAGSAASCRSPASRSLRITGDIYAGLWYSVGFTALSVLVTIFFLKETRGKPLEEC